MYATERMLEVHVTPVKDTAEVGVELLKLGTSLRAFCCLMIRLSAGGKRIRTQKQTFNPTDLIRRIEDILLRGKCSPFWWSRERHFPSKFGILAWVNDYLSIYEAARLHPLRYSLDDMVICMPSGAEYSVDGADWLAVQMLSVGGYESQSRLVGEQLLLPECVDLSIDPCGNCELFGCHAVAYCSHKLAYVAVMELVSSGDTLSSAMSTVGSMLDAYA
jgi:hypothetical protein